MLKNGEIKLRLSFELVFSFSSRHLEVDLETIWQATNADNIHLREQLLDMR
jgi:hypothetical protein